jgi:hypothetical protein
VPDHWPQLLESNANYAQKLGLDPELFQGMSPEGALDILKMVELDLKKDTNPAPQPNKNQWVGFVTTAGGVLSTVSQAAQPVLENIQSAAKDVAWKANQLANLTINTAVAATTASLVVYMGVNGPVKTVGSIMDGGASIPKVLEAIPCAVQQVKVGKILEPAGGPPPTYLEALESCMGRDR